MIKEKQNAQSKAYRVGDFKNRKAIGDAARYLFINLPEKLSYVRICIKGHNREGCAKKGNQTDESSFDNMKELMGSSCFFVGKNKIRFAYMGDGKFRLFFLDQIHQVHGSHHIPAGFFRVQVGNRKNPKAVEKLCVGTGQTGNILKVYMRMMNFDVLVKLKI